MGGNGSRDLLGQLEWSCSVWNVTRISQLYTDAIVNIAVSRFFFRLFDPVICELAKAKVCVIHGRFCRADDEMLPSIDGAEAGHTKWWREDFKIFTIIKMFIRMCLYDNLTVLFQYV